MISQDRYIKVFKNELDTQANRLKEMFASLVEYNSAGECVPKSSTNVKQLKAIKDGLQSVLAILDEVKVNTKKLNKEIKDADIEVNKTRDLLIAFSKEYKIVLPSILTKLYRIT
jgi:septal ring factor EnvC (AmiA/AmiB activator)